MDSDLRLEVIGSDRDVVQARCWCNRLLDRLLFGALSIELGQTSDGKHAKDKQDWAAKAKAADDQQLSEMTFKDVQRAFCEPSACKVFSAADDTEGQEATEVCEVCDDDTQSPVVPCLLSDPDGVVLSG